MKGLKLIIAVVVLVVVGVSGWHLTRWFNYEFGYNAKIEQTVCHMVKPAALINPSKCK